MTIRANRPQTAAFAALCASALLVGNDATAQQLRFSTTAPGAIVATGNTLGLGKQLNANGPGTLDSIGTFIAFDATSVDNVPENTSNPWPMGTTNDWTANGSTAELDFPPDVEVLYAELVWAGNAKDNGGEDVTANLDDAITLHFGSDSMSVSPATATAQSFDNVLSGAASYYIRSAEVTSFVQTHGAGDYTVAGVPATQSAAIDSVNAAGWTLIVAVRGESQPTLRNLSVFVGGSFVDENSEQDYTVSGFCAPQTGPVDGKLVVSALEGDANLSGDELLIGTSVSGPFVNLQGTNNPSGNFFASQINDAAGELNTEGSFGTFNHDAAGAANLSGGRQGWDLTTVQVSSMNDQLVNAQTEAVIRTTTTGDSYVPAVVALEIDVKSPDFSASSTDADKDLAGIGDSITLTATLSNTGEAPATNLVLNMPIDSGLTLTGYTTNGEDGDAQGNSVAGAQVEAGVDAGTLEDDETLTVVMTFDVVDAAANGSAFVFAPAWEHSFVVCDGDDPIAESHTPPEATVAYDAPVTSGVGGAGPASSSSSSSSSSSAGGETGSGITGDPVEETGGCGCRTPAHDRSSHWGGLAALFALGLLRRRRSR